MLPARIAGLALVILLGIVAPTRATDQRAAPTEKADRIVVVKSARTLTLLNRGQVLKTYNVALGGDPVGPDLPPAFVHVRIRQVSV